MAYFDWAYYGPNFLSLPNQAVPGGLIIPGTGQQARKLPAPSGRFALNHAYGVNGFGAACAMPMALPHGALRGGLRGSLAAQFFRAQSEIVTGIGSALGVLAMCSQEDMRAQGTCYAALLSSPYASGTRVTLAKFTDGLTTPPIALATSPVDLWTYGRHWALELLWDATPVALDVYGGARLTVRFGATEEALTPLDGLTNVVDEDDPLTTTAFEGVGSVVEQSPGFTGSTIFQWNAYFDRVRWGGFL